MSHTFKGGVHPADRKSSTRDIQVRTLEIPPYVAIPLSQHIGAPCKPLVKPKDRVKTGQVIGTSEKFISSPVHSSVTGTVRAVEDTDHPVMGRFSAVIIDAEERDELDYSDPISDFEALDQKDLLEAVRRAGVVGMGGAMFPTHVKLSVPKDKTVDTLIINGAECEPYLTCDYRLMMEGPKDIITGAKILMKILGVKRTFIGIETNKQPALESLRNAFGGNKVRYKKYWSGRSLNVVPLKVKYPQGAEKQLIKAIVRREIPPKGLPFDVGCVVCNVATVVAVKEAVCDGKPLYERVLTVSGSAVNRPANLKVRIGTPVSWLAEECGGFNEMPAKIISGGPMMGITQTGTGFPVIKGTSGLLFLNKDESAVKEWGPCIRCGRCMQACPMNISPAVISTAAERERFDIAERAGVTDCIECGACAYVCPYYRPIVHFAKLAKKKLIKKI